MIAENASLKRQNEILLRENENFRRQNIAPDASVPMRMSLTGITIGLYIIVFFVNLMHLIC